MSIVLIPGLLCDRYCWEPVLDHLTEATVADLGSQDTITQMATDCLALSEGLLEVAGHSMGARVAMEMARLAPNRVQRLVLMDTGYKPLGEGEEEKRAEIVAYGHEHGMRALADRWLPPMVHEPNRTPELMSALTDMVLRSNPDRHERQIHALVNRPDAGAYLPGITCPTLVVVGRQDQWSPVEQHQDIMALLPNARLEIVENAGHFAPVEQPDVVGPMVAAFLKGES